MVSTWIYVNVAVSLVSFGVVVAVGNVDVVVDVVVVAAAAVSNSVSFLLLHTNSTLTL